MHNPNYIIIILTVFIYFLRYIMCMGISLVASILNIIYTKMSISKPNIAKITISFWTCKFIELIDFWKGCTFKRMFLWIKCFYGCFSRIKSMFCKRMLTTRSYWKGSRKRYVLSYSLTYISLKFLFWRLDILYGITNTILSISSSFIIY